MISPTTFPKLLTCLAGLALLLPLMVSFGIMAAHRPRSQAELQKSLDAALATLKAEIDSKVEPGSLSLMAGNVQVTDQIKLPGVSYRLWSPFSRRWVGVVGLVCCLVLSGLWIYSAWFPTPSLTGEYGRSGTDGEPPGFVQPPIEGIDSKGSWDTAHEKKD